MRDRSSSYTIKNIETLENSLHNLCCDFISYLDQFMNLGKISREEYDKHSKVKKDFIKQKGKHL